MEAICGETPFRGQKSISGGSFGSLVNEFIQNVQVLVWLVWFTQYKH